MLSLLDYENKLLIMIILRDVGQLNKLKPSEAGGDFTYAVTCL